MLPFYIWQQINFIKAPIQGEEKQSVSQQVWHHTFLWINYIYFHLCTYLLYIIFQECPVDPIIIIDRFSRPSLSPTSSMTLYTFVPCSTFLVTIFSLLLLPGIYTINKILSKYQRSIQRLSVWGLGSIFPWWTDVQNESSKCLSAD